MEITERTHGHLVGEYYKVLKEDFGELGIRVFAEATKRYGEERGKRMALRAKKHGFKLDYFAYMSHSEWEPTSNKNFDIREEFLENGDYCTYNYSCPWNDTFKEMDLIECGLEYCKYIDKALVKGFNENLELDVDSVIHNSDYCTFCWKQAKFDKETSKRINEVKKKYREENIKPFIYHIGHLHKVFKTEIINAHEKAGAYSIKRVLDKMESKFGSELVEVLKAFETVDFSIID